MANRHLPEWRIAGFKIRPNGWSESDHLEMIFPQHRMARLSNPEPNVLALQGEIDLHESPVVKDRLLKMLESKPPVLFVDLSGVDYIDSSGLATLIEAMQRINVYGGRLALYGIRGNVQNIFRIARLDQVFRIFPDKTAAFEALK